MFSYNTGRITYQKFTQPASSNKVSAKLQGFSSDLKRLQLLSEAFIRKIDLRLKRLSKAMQSLLVCPSVAIVRPYGALNAATAAEFRHQLHTAVLSEQNSALLIDMSKVESLDSAGLMILVSALNLAQTNQKRFSLCCLTMSVRIVFELTQLDRVFEIFESLSAFELATA